MNENIRRSISVYYCGNIDNFIHDVNTISYNELRELISYNGNNVVCLLFKEIKIEGKAKIEKSYWINGNDKEYINKLCDWFECENIKELEMKVKLKRH